VVDANGVPHRPVGDGPCVDFPDGLLGPPPDAYDDGYPTLLGVGAPLDGQPLEERLHGEGRREPHELPEGLPSARGPDPYRRPGLALRHRLNALVSSSHA